LVTTERLIQRLVDVAADRHERDTPRRKFHPIGVQYLDPRQTAAHPPDLLGHIADTVAGHRQ